MTRYLVREGTKRGMGQYVHLPPGSRHPLAWDWGSRKGAMVYQGWDFAASDALACGGRVVRLVPKRPKTGSELAKEYGFTPHQLAAFERRGWQRRFGLPETNETDEAIVDRLVHEKARAERPMRVASTEFQQAVRDDERVRALEAVADAARKLVYQPGSGFLLNAAVEAIDALDATEAVEESK